MVLSAETSTALPVLLPRMIGWGSSANRFKIWTPLVTPIPITRIKLTIFTGLKGIPSQPIKPSIQQKPSATGKSASSTELKRRKWRNTRTAIMTAA